MQRAKGTAQSVNQRMLLKGSLLPAPCAMQKGTAHCLALELEGSPSIARTHE
jgi:hypothetical protein